MSQQVPLLDSQDPSNNDAQQQTSESESPSSDVLIDDMRTQLYNQATIISLLSYQRDFLLMQIAEIKARQEAEKDEWERITEVLIARRYGGRYESEADGGGTEKEQRLERQCASYEFENKALKAQISDNHMRLATLESELKKIRPLLITQLLHSPGASNAHQSTLPIESGTSPQQPTTRGVHQPIPPHSASTSTGYYRRYNDTPSDTTPTTHPDATVPIHEQTTQSPVSSSRKRKLSATAQTSDAINISLLNDFNTPSQGSVQPRRIANTHKHTKASGKRSKGIPLLSDAHAEHLLLAVRKIGKERVRARVLAGLGDREDGSQAAREKERDRGEQTMPNVVVTTPAAGAGLASPKTPKRGSTTLYNLPHPGAFSHYAPTAHLFSGPASPSPRTHQPYGSLGSMYATPYAFNSGSPARGSGPSYTYLGSPVSNAGANKALNSSLTPRMSTAAITDSGHGTAERAVLDAGSMKTPQKPASITSNVTGTPLDSLLSAARMMDEERKNEGDIGEDEEGEPNILDTPSGRHKKNVRGRRKVVSETRRGSKRNAADNGSPVAKRRRIEVAMEKGAQGNDTGRVRSALDVLADQASVAASEAHLQSRRMRRPSGSEARRIIGDLGGTTSGQTDTDEGKCEENGEDKDEQDAEIQGGDAGLSSCGRPLRSTRIRAMRERETKEKAVGKGKAATKGRGANHERQAASSKPQKRNQKAGNPEPKESEDSEMQLLTTAADTAGGRSPSPQLLTAAIPRMFNAADGQPVMTSNESSANSAQHDARPGDVNDSDETMGLQEKHQTVSEVQVSPIEDNAAVSHKEQALPSDPKQTLEDSTEHQDLASNLETLADAQSRKESLCTRNSNDKATDTDRISIPNSAPNRDAGHCEEVTTVTTEAEILNQDSRMVTLEEEAKEVAVEEQSHSVYLVQAVERLSPAAEPPAPPLALKASPRAFTAGNLDVPQNPVIAPPDSSIPIDIPIDDDEDLDAEGEPECDPDMLYSPFILPRPVEPLSLDGPSHLLVSGATNDTHSDTVVHPASHPSVVSSDQPFSSTERSKSTPSLGHTNPLSTELDPPPSNTSSFHGVTRVDLGYPFNNSYEHTFLLSDGTDSSGTMAEPSLLLSGPHALGFFPDGTHSNAVNGQLDPGSSSATSHLLQREANMYVNDQQLPEKRLQSRHGNWVIDEDELPTQGAPT